MTSSTIHQFPFASTNLKRIIVSTKIQGSEESREAELLVISIIAITNIKLAHMHASMDVTWLPCVNGMAEHIFREANLVIHTS